MAGKKRVLVFFGMIAAGKSLLAKTFADKWGCRYHNSDVIRKELAGVTLESRQFSNIDSGIYTREFSRLTYDEMATRAVEDLKRNEPCVVLDGSYQSRSERERICRKIGTKFPVLFILCRCSETVMKARMDKRLQDPNAVSDGRWEIYLRQKERFEMPEELTDDQLLVLDTDTTIEQLLCLLECNLGLPTGGNCD